ncbi:nucleotidyl transferase AbiEii/AbiGii toxin family protein [Candidatus Woesearchaeota archaeon]|nr:nucleotidyl transferase AbiEii/AbiGii toxin family protein [Candidatus Woesearchaeota archaeon]
MIPLAELKRIAAKNSVALSVVEKDYAITWILYALAETMFKECFIFKGGTALRKVYFPAWRYSEDLDFTATKLLNEIEVKELISSVNYYLYEKIKMSITYKSLYLNPEYAQLKIQFLGPLNRENTIKLDISFSEFLVLPPENKLIHSEYSDKEKHFLYVYSLEESLAEKIRSILQRGKTRDYYDVWRILKWHYKLINKTKTKEILNQKCKFKNIICNEKLLFGQEKVDNAKKHWEKGLGYQINDLPDFDIVITECKYLLMQFLK